MAGDSPDTKGQPGLAAAALFGLCPRCGEKTLFDGAARFAPRCSHCGLDYGTFNVGDGPAAFLTMVIGVLVVGLAFWVEVRFHPPLWVHAVLWIPFVTLSTLRGLRVTKAALLYTEHQRRAREVTNRDIRPD